MDRDPAVVVADRPRADGAASSAEEHAGRIPGLILTIDPPRARQRARQRPRTRNGPPRRRADRHFEESLGGKTSILATETVQPGTNRVYLPVGEMLRPDQRDQPPDV